MDSKYFFVSLHLTQLVCGIVTPYHVVKPSTGKASAFWGNTEVFVDGSAQRDTITMLKDGKIGEFEASSLQEFCLLNTFAQL